MDVASPRFASLLGALMCAFLIASAAAAAGGGSRSHVLFTSNRTGTWRLYGVNPDGSGLADLGAPASSLLPDGHLLRSEGHIVLTDELGRRRRDLGSGLLRGISPDRRRVAFFDQDNKGDGEIGVVDLDGSHRRIVLRSAQYEDSVIGWLRRSASLIVLHRDFDYSNRDRLIRVDLGPRARVRTVLRGSLSSSVVSARGVVAFTDAGQSGKQRLRVFDLMRPKGTPVVATASMLGVPEWSPDGRRLAYVRSDSAVSAWRALVIASGGRRTTLLTGRLFDLGPNAWSPSGDALAVGAGEASGAQLVVVGVDGHVLGRVRSKSLVAFTWSPDGSLISFGFGDLFVVGRDGAGLRRLTGAGSNELLGWAPGPVPRGSPRATPLPPTEAVAGLTLRSRGPVRELAADGSWVAAIVGATRRDCDHVVAWRAGASHAFRFERSAPCQGNEEATGLALNGAAVTWSSFYCGNDCYQTPISADTARPGRQNVGQEQDVGSSAPAPMRPSPPAETHHRIAFSVVQGRIRLERTTDGHAITIAAPGRLVDAELEDAGLFYAYNVARGPMPGRVTFIPLAQLERRF